MNAGVPKGNTAEAVHDQMIMKDRKRSKAPKLPGNGEFAAGHRTINEDEPHAHTIALSLCDFAGMLLVFTGAGCRRYNLPGTPT